MWREQRTGTKCKEGLKPRIAAGKRKIEIKGRRELIKEIFCAVCAPCKIGKTMEMTKMYVQGKTNEMGTRYEWEER